MAEFSGVNRTTNLTNAAGQTGAAIFNNYTGLTVTNNTRPAGNTSVLGHLLRRVHRHARSADHPARGQGVLLVHRLALLAEPSTDPGAGQLDVLERHLRFALDGDGVDLCMLAAIVRVTAPDDIASIVRRKPIGVFARRLWYLYEWLTHQKLDVPEAAGRLRFVPVLDPARQVALKAGTPSGRHRVIDNLPGTRRFCPMVRWTPALRAASAKRWDVRARAVIDATPPDRRPSLATWLQRSDAGSSFALAGEETSARRTARLGRRDRPGRRPGPDARRAAAAAAGRLRRQAVRGPRPSPKPRR